MECCQDDNLKNCACSYPCERKGRCCDCVTYHKRRGELPACFFSEAAERTYDRSISKFIEDNK